MRWFSTCSFSLASRARIFSSRAVLTMPRENLVEAVLLVPLGERGRHVHLLDDVAPADAGVIGAEGDLALVRGIAARGNRCSLILTAL
jgi:hypothetical protein